MIATRNQTDQLRSQIRQVSIRVSSLKESYDLKKKLPLILNLFMSRVVLHGIIILCIQCTSGAPGSNCFREHRLLGLVVSAGPK